MRHIKLSTAVHSWHSSHDVCAQHHFPCSSAPASGPCTQTISPSARYLSVDSAFYILHDIRALRFCNVPPVIQQHLSMVLHNPVVPRTKPCSYILQVQTPQQRRANEKFAKQETARRGKAEAPVKQKQKFKPPISPLWIGICVNKREKNPLLIKYRNSRFCRRWWIDL